MAYVSSWPDQPHHPTPAPILQISCAWQENTMQSKNAPSSFDCYNALRNFSSRACYDMGHFEGSFCPVSGQIKPIKLYLKELVLHRNDEWMVKTHCKERRKCLSWDSYHGCSVIMTVVVVITSYRARDTIQAGTPSSGLYNNICQRRKTKSCWSDWYF